MSRPRVAVLISGRGSNMVALLEAAAHPDYPAEIALVVANRADAAGLGRAAEMRVPTALVPSRGRPREEFEAELSAVLAAHRIAILALAGFMRVLTAGFVQGWEGWMINIHPSLLPAFPGLHTHRRALQAGCKAVGATVHLVTAELDHGPIVMQSVVPVRPGDDEHTLAARVLATEHVIYPLSVRWFVEGKLAIEDGLVRQTDGASQVLM